MCTMNLLLFIVASFLVGGVSAYPNKFCNARSSSIMAMIRDSHMALYTQYRHNNKGYLAECTTFNNHAQTAIVLEWYNLEIGWLFDSYVPLFQKIEEFYMYECNSLNGGSSNKNSRYPLPNMDARDNQTLQHLFTGNEIFLAESKKINKYMTEYISKVLAKAITYINLVYAYGEGIQVSKCCQKDQTKFSKCLSELDALQKAISTKEMRFKHLLGFDQKNPSVKKLISEMRVRRLHVNKCGREKYGGLEVTMCP